MQNTFLTDVQEGLSDTPKRLHSKYFYDARGDDLFIQIMALPEYYLTRAEMEIFQTQSEEMIQTFDVSKDEPFELIELGAGDGTKTRHLLAALLEGGYDFTYIPIDISGNVLDVLRENLSKDLPGLKIKPRTGDYFQILSELGAGDSRKVLLYLGSNLGNLVDEKAARFMYELGAALSARDKLVLGVDKVKPRETVLPAYSDAQGVTAEFNLNLLRRINRELGADFDVDGFQHVAEYQQDEGIARSFLESLKDQQVTLDGRAYDFKAGERIYMEISRKYSREILRDILKDTDFSIRDVLTDENELFLDVVLERGRA